jgi:cobyrinic acid a,c-diamide synthase
VSSAPPRLVVAGLGGDSGKTMVSLALVQAARRAGLDVRPFKKGPDYIDPAWLAWAADRPARNLDTWLMGVDGARQAFGRAAAGADLAIVEGNRGLYDGVDAAGTHSTAELAKAIDAPVLLVIDTRKVTRTVAAFVLGCQALDPGVRMAGVVLNQVHGSRHEAVMRDAITLTCGIPVVGVVPRIGGETPLPGRHLGLVTPAEHGGRDELAVSLAELVAPGLDLPAILALARAAGPFEWPSGPTREPADGAGLRVGYVSDSAFTFYYPENLEALTAAGAELVPVSSLEAAALPPALDALYIGGGFPETHAAPLAANRALLADLRRRAGEGLPIYAECGGLMLLARSLRLGGRVHEMAGVLACDVELCAAPQGHGYAELTVDRPNAFFPAGLSIRGHEFHYSRLVADEDLPDTACAVRRGVGVSAGRDAIVTASVWASYTHVHAQATPEWAEGLLGAARAYARRAATTTPPFAGPRAGAIG